MFTRCTLIAIILSLSGISLGNAEPKVESPAANKVSTSPNPKMDSAVEKKVTLSDAEKRMALMNKVLKRLLQKIAEARRADNIHRVNCLTLKLNSAKGMIRASEKAHVVMLEAAYENDLVTSQSFAKKIMTYADTVDEIEHAMDECSGASAKSEGTTLVYIRPEEPEMTTKESSPWSKSDNAGGAESYPSVPPASPFR